MQRRFPFNSKAIKIKVNVTAVQLVQFKTILKNFQGKLLIDDFINVMKMSFCGYGGFRVFLRTFIVVVIKLLSNSNF